MIHETGMRMELTIWIDFTPFIKQMKQITQVTMQPTNMPPLKLLASN